MAPDLRTDVSIGAGQASNLPEPPITDCRLPPVVASVMRYTLRGQLTFALAQLPEQVANGVPEIASRTRELNPVLPRSTGDAPSCEFVRRECPGRS